MSRFYVGQRVRIVGCHDPDDFLAMRLIGSEAVVNALDIVNQLDETGNIGVTVDGDEAWCFLPDELEPLTDSYDKTEWKDCLWQPEHLRETV